MTNEQQKAFLVEEGLGDGYDIIMDIIDDHVELESMGYDVMAIVKKYMTLI